MKYIILTIGAFLLVIIYACSPTGAVFEDNLISIDVDAEVTETWVTLRSIPVEKNAVYYVSRDDSLIFEGKLAQSDTLIHDENLEPSRTYNYAAYADKGVEQSKTVRATATTMDTTSHDFEWEIILVSDRLDVNLHDVSIVDENNIWVVGFVPSNTGQHYNAVHWDGTKWNLERIIMKGNIAPDGPHEIYCIYAEANNNIWVSNASYGHWNGHNWESEYKALSRRKIWSNGNNNVWFVGLNGKINFFDGSTWLEQDSKTTIKLRDIYGFSDNLNNRRIIYACGFNFGFEEGVILKKENNDDWTILDSGNSGLISLQGSGNNFASLWMANINTVCVTVFNDVYKIRQVDNNKYYQKKILAGVNGIYRIRGNEINDMFIAGDDIQLSHFNGVNWNYYNNFGPSTTINSLDFKNNIIVAVSSGSIFIGRRN